MYKFARVESGEMKRYMFCNLESATNWVNKELQMFKITNCVTDETKDKAFIAYKAELEQVLSSPPSRDKQDNIPIAKEMRDRGEGPWQNC